MLFLWRSMFDDFNVYRKVDNEVPPLSNRRKGKGIINWQFCSSSALFFSCFIGRTAAARSGLVRANGLNSTPHHASFFMSTPAAAAHNIWLISHANLARLQPPSFFLPFPPPAPRAVRIDSPNYLCRKMCKYCVHYC